MKQEVKFFLTAAALFLFIRTALAGQVGCVTPPFVTRAIKPNVMLVVDNSGSMYNFAYPDYDDYDPSNRYYGYFDPDHWYRYDSSAGAFIPTAAKSERDKQSNEWDGNFLNWVTMRRVDVLKKVLTGGEYDGTYLEADMPDYYGRGIRKKYYDVERYTPYSGTRYFVHSTSYYGGVARFRVCRYSNSYCSNYYYVRVKPIGEPRGIVQEIGDRVRWGLAFYNTNPHDWNDSPNGGRVSVHIPADDIQTLVNRINDMVPSTNTPLAETLWTVTGYFMQKSRALDGPGPRYQNGDYSISTDVDPYNYDGQMAWCAKSYVIYITDGEPCADGYIPPSLRNYADSHGGCVYNDSLPSCSAGGNYARMEDVALYAHTVDLRPDLPHDQVITIYPVFVFGHGSEFLKCVAINGGFQDENGNNEPDQQHEWDKDGDGVPDNYYAAETGLEIEDAIYSAFRDILARTASGTSVSVISERAEKGANLVQAVFHPKKVFRDGLQAVAISWVGFLNNFWLIKGETPETTTIREDTDTDKMLDPADDMIIDFGYSTDNDLVIELYADSDRDGVCDNTDESGECVADSTATFDTVKKLWEAGQELHTRDAADRHVWVAIDVNGDGEINEEDEFSTIYASQLQHYLYAAGEDEAEKIIDYVRGVDFTGFRSREVSGSTWKLGDIIYSTPRIVDYRSNDPAQTYSVVYVGANDGMLHAFKMGKVRFDSSPPHQAQLCDSAMGECTTNDLGKELWAFVPTGVLPYLRELTKTNYCHYYYVDLSPFVYRDSVTGRVLLIGGMRLGGGCACTGDNCVTPPPYECRDSSGSNTVPCDSPGAVPYCVYRDGSIKKCDTDDDGVWEDSVVGYSEYFALDVTDPLHPRLLWEFSHPWLGLSYSGPALIKEGSAYLVAFASGPTSPDGVSDQPLRVFLLHLDDSFRLQSYQVIDKVDGDELDNAFGGRLFQYVENPSFENAVYFGYVQQGSWKGGVLRLYPSQEGGWKLGYVLKDAGPVTASVKMALVGGERWIAFGEGRYFTGPDDDPDARRRIYAVKASCSGCTPNSLTDATNNPEGVSAPTGWYIWMDAPGEGYAAERVITDPILVDTGYETAAIFVSLQPTNMLCSYGGRTSVWAVTLTGGGALENPSLGGKLFVQVSTGQIATYTSVENRKTEPVVGVPSETAPAFVHAFSSAKMKVKMLGVVER